MRGWRELQPGDRVVSVAGATGTVVRVSVPKRGQSKGLAWVRVRWDNGAEGRVSPPTIGGRA
jgi:hypothetical protein